MHAFIAGDEGDDTAEEHGLDEAVDDVADFRKEFDGIHIGEMREPGAQCGHAVAAGRTDDIAVKGQDRHHDDAGYKARYDEIGNGIDGHTAQGIDLFRNLHGPDFSRHGRTDAACHDDAS